MDVLSKFVYVVFGFRASEGPGYPCHWCGVVTQLRDAEDFSACRACQKDYINLGYQGMRDKYPLTGKDERNPRFFKEESERHVARAHHLTPDELRLLIERGCVYEKGFAQAILDGKTLDKFEPWEIEWLGSSAEQYIDHW